MKPHLPRQAQIWAAHLSQQPDGTLADVAYTLQVGRRHFPYRQAVVAGNFEDAVQKLQSVDLAPRNSEPVRGSHHEIAFLFPGGGAQYQNMGRDLYAHEPIFRSVIDECAALLQPRLGLDIRSLLYPATAGDAAAEQQLERPSLALPLLFSVEFALAKLWQASRVCSVQP